MADEREEVTLRSLSRWLLVAVLVLAGLGLDFAFGRTAQPVVQEPSLEAH